MNELTAFWNQSPHLAGLLVLAIINAAVTTMPTPTKDSPGWYRWLFNFAHALVLAIPRIINANKQSPDEGVNKP